MRVLGLSGSIRTGSLNARLLEAALARCRQAGHEADAFDVRQAEIPLYDGDLEAEHGCPAGVWSLKQAVRAADALIFASPEYNAGPTPLLKNLIDWTSRTYEEPKTGNEWAGKPALILSASPGGMGGLRAASSLRLILADVRCLVVPEQAAVGRAHQVLDESGDISDERSAAMLQKSIDALLKLASVG
ncbi:MAG: NAD(P)H-dependent oxidoreductase [Fimbriimonadaceae bacterium]|nr:NAD(P)H-dependent oxidoreductase [Fimbriimonadaceae bacterium]